MSQLHRTVVVSKSSFNLHIHMSLSIQKCTFFTFFFKIRSKKIQEYLNLNRVHPLNTENKCNFYSILQVRLHLSKQK